MHKLDTLPEKFNFASINEFDDHQSITCLMDKKTGLKGFVTIHRSNSHHPAFGATRIWSYKSELDALKDSLRLSRTMSYKCALAGLKYGGAKGVLIMPDNVRHRKELFKIYAKRINTFSGSFITGADVGVSREDVINMKKLSKFFVGTQTDPVRFTALGIYYAIEVCLHEVFGNKSVEKRTFAIQGLGKVGSAVLDYIYPSAEKVYATDVDKLCLKTISKKYPKVEFVLPEEIHKQKVNVFVPCALSSCINSKSVNELKCEIVAGGANNQLDNDETGERLHKLGILYAPDFVANAGGLISVADEYEYGNYRVKRVEKRVENIKRVLKKIVTESERMNTGTNYVAQIMARRKVDTYL